jgi:hypothetical protein
MDLTAVSSAPPDAPSVRPTAAAPSAPADDMRDAPEDLSKSTPLGRYLRRCAEELLPIYAQADSASLASQRRHRRIVRWSAGTATAAVLLALAESAAEGRLSPPVPFILLILEGTAVLVTAILIVIGLISLGQTPWLLERYRAERVRLLKFRVLVDPSLWAGPSASADAWEERFRRELEVIRKLRAGDLTSASQREDVAVLPHPRDCGNVAAEDAAELLDYYARRRLNRQIDYFQTSAQRASRQPLGGPYLVPLFFFLGLVGSLLHWIYQIASLTPEKGFLGLLSAGALAAAAILPALWKGLRTYRGANEFARNASRSTAKQSALTQLAARLKETRDPSLLFGNLALCESVLASDQQEWLRLMLGARWYG